MEFLILSVKLAVIWSWLSTSLGVIGLVSLTEDLVTWASVFHKIVMLYRYAIELVFSDIMRLTGLQVPPEYHDYLFLTVILLSATNVGFYWKRKQIFPTAVLGISIKLTVMSASVLLMFLATILRATVDNIERKKFALELRKFWSNVSAETITPRFQILLLLLVAMMFIVGLSVLLLPFYVSNWTVFGVLFLPVSATALAAFIAWQWVLAVTGIYFTIVVGNYVYLQFLI